MVVAQIVGTFFLTLIGWLLFRVTSMENFTAITANIFGNFHWCDESMKYLLPTVTSLTLLVAFHVWQERTGGELVLLRLGPWWRLGAFVFLLTCIWVAGCRNVLFVYFQF